MIEWLLFTLLAIVVQGFFALFEMASVSMSKVRLQYYESKGNARARWLHYLLKRPSRLFGTTLIGINTALQMGSECARRFYESIHLDPDWAPVSQVFIVVIFAELVPLFTARRHPEQIAMTFSPVMLVFAKLLSPVIWIFDKCSQLIHKALGKAEETPLFLSREEVLLAFEEPLSSEDEFGALVRSTFQFKQLTAGNVMLPLAKADVFNASMSVQAVREQFAKRSLSPVVLAVYHQSPRHITGVVFLRDLLASQGHQVILERAKSPWFVTQNTPVLQLLSQFRKNGQSLAVVLDPSGQASGLLTLDQIVDALFGPEEKLEPEEGPESQSHFVERTLKGTLSIGEFNRQFQADLEGNEEEMLADWILAKLDHPPAKGETVRIVGYEFTIVEPTVRGIRTLSVRSLLE